MKLNTLTLVATGFLAVPVMMAAPQAQALTMRGLFDMIASRGRCCSAIDYAGPVARPGGTAYTGEKYLPASTQTFLADARRNGKPYIISTKFINGREVITQVNVGGAIVKGVVMGGTNRPGGGATTVLSKPGYVDGGGVARPGTPPPCNNSSNC